MTVTPVLTMKTPLAMFVPKEPSKLLLHYDRSQLCCPPITANGLIVTMLNGFVFELHLQ